MNARQIFLWCFLALIVARIVFHEQLNTAFDSWRMKGCERVKEVDAYDMAVNPLNGDVWGTSYDGLFQFNGKEWRFHKVPSLKEGYVTEAFLVFDPQGRLWQGGWDGVSVFDGHGWTFYDERDWGLSDIIVTSIAFDPIENPWVGFSTSGVSSPDVCGGISVLDDQRWITYRFENTSFTGPGCQFVQSIQFDSSGRAWVGLRNGALMVLEETQDETFQAATPGGPVFSSTVRSAGYFLIPEESFPNENDKRPVVIKDFSVNSIIYNTTNDGKNVGVIHSVLFDKRGNPWVNAEDKLYQIKDDEFILARSPATRTVMDRDGNIWSIGQGISVYDGATWKTYRAGDSCIGNEDVLTLTFDNDNRGWAARYPNAEEGFSLSVFDQPPDRAPDVALRLRAIFLPSSSIRFSWLGIIILTGIWLLFVLGVKLPALTFPLLNISLALATEQIRNGGYHSIFAFELIAIFSLGGGVINAITNRHKREDGFWKNAAPGFYGALVGWLSLIILIVLGRILFPPN